MTVDLVRIRCALRALDALMVRFPGLRAPWSQSRLAKHLDGGNEEGDRGRHHGNEKEGRR